MDCRTRKIRGITVGRSMKVNLFLCGFKVNHSQLKKKIETLEETSTSEVKLKKGDEYVETTIGNNFF